MQGRDGGAEGRPEPGPSELSFQGKNMKEPEIDAETTRARVREHYGRIGVRADLGGGKSSAGGCCAGEAPSRGGGCCGPSKEVGASSERSSEPSGYTAASLSELPEGADLGLGCGNPTGLLSLGSGETVLDLGSGAGIDCFLAARKVGRRGRVIGVDMTPEMVTRARENARRSHVANVEFRLGEIEHLPVADSSVDVVISNCVINLAPDQQPVYREAFRVLRPGGRLAISDVVATRPLSRKEREDPSGWTSCFSGALEVREIKRLLRKAGFTRIEVTVRTEALGGPAGSGPAASVVTPADLLATKP